MLNILSIQSHVAFGYVGNRAATFPLQRLGHNVIAINTVQFSNHTGYGSFTGQIFSSQHIKELIAGLEEKRFLQNCNALLSGYLGDHTIGEVIVETAQKLKKSNSNVIFCCDPVMGDVDRGFFVKSGIFEFIRDKALKEADIITPNQFEASALSKINITDLSSAKEACNVLYNIGPKIIVITSLMVKELASEKSISVLLFDGKEFWLITTPYINFKISPTGCGDLFSALFLGHFLENKNPLIALEKTIYSTYNILEKTYNMNERELQIIPAQDYITNTHSNIFKAKII